MFDRNTQSKSPYCTHQELPLSHEIPNILLILLVVWGVGLAFRATMMQSMFIGIGMSITANPVTVKIFKDFNFTGSSSTW